MNIVLQLSLYESKALYFVLIAETCLCNMCTSHLFYKSSIVLQLNCIFSIAFVVLISVN